MLSPQERNALAPGLPAAPLFSAAGRTRTPLDCALAVDTARSLPDQLLFKMDIATMASSLEARAPLLDYRLVEWAARLPNSFKQRGLERKRLIVDASPATFRPSCRSGRRWAYRPIAAWLRGELYELTVDTLLSSASRDRGIVRPAAVQQLIERHRRGEDHNRGLWALLMLELWHQEFVDGTSRMSSVASPA